MGFFLDLFGFTGKSYQDTQAALLDMATFTPVPTPYYFRERCDFALADGRTVSAGIFSTPSVADLRTMVQTACTTDNTAVNTDTKNIAQIGNLKTTVQNIVGEAKSLHRSSAEGSVVQAASQFNFLEMPGPKVTPDAGIEEYEFDPTQGPACAVACGAGTAYRNYLVPVPIPSLESRDQSISSRGQTKHSQLNGLDGVERYLGDLFVGDDDVVVPWIVKNGYVEAPDSEGLEKFNQRLLSKPELRDEIVSRVKIGVQEETAVTHRLSEGNRIVTQTYNSAISIGYSRRKLAQWEPVARAVLDATYEATLLVGILKTFEAILNGSPPPPILLTKVGGGVFKNKDSWIRRSIQNALERVEIYGVGLDVRIVHFGRIKARYVELER